MTGMKLYADAPARRTAQLVGDALLLVWVVGWVLVARAVHGTVLLLARPGREISQAGDRLAARMRDAGQAVGGTPLLGEAVRSPLDGAGAAADRLAAAGRSQVEAVSQLAWWLALVIAAVPVLLALALYLPRRWRFVRTAGAARRVLGSGADADLFALRALSRQPLHRLLEISDDPAGAWRERHPDVVRRLALLELADAGLRPLP